MALVEAQFQIGDVVFGGYDNDLIVEDADFGTAEITTQDADNPVGNGIFVGTDRFGSTTWQFSIATNLSRGSDALETARRFAAAWREELAPGVVVPLKFKAGGRVLRAYGRPRKLSSPVPNVRTQQGVALLDAEFVLSDPLVYDDDPTVLTLDPPDLTHSGVTLPATLPFVLGAVSGERQGVVHVDGTADVPFTVEVHGPTTGHLTSPVVSAKGWRVAFPGLKVAYDQTLIVDMREHTARIGGRNVAGDLDGKSVLDARLEPGKTEVTFDRVDSTNTAWARVVWRTGYWGF